MEVKWLEEEYKRKGSDMKMFKKKEKKSKKTQKVKVKPKVIEKRKINGKEVYGRNWSPVYYKNKPAMKDRTTGNISIPSDAYVKRHHPQGPWDS